MVFPEFIWPPHNCIRSLRDCFECIAFASFFWTLSHLACYIVYVFGCSFVWTARFGQNHDAFLCSSSAARHGSCRSQLLFCYHTWSLAEDVRSLLRVSQNAQRSRACPGAGKLKCQNYCCSYCRRWGSYHHSGIPVEFDGVLERLLVSIEFRAT